MKSTGSVLLALYLITGGAGTVRAQMLDSARVEAFFDRAWAERRSCSAQSSPSSLLVGLFALTGLLVAVLLPYWHLVGNLRDP